MNKIVLGVLAASLVALNSYAMNIDQAVDSALGNNFEILMQKHKVQSSEYQAKVAATGYFPQLNAKYNYQKSNENAFGSKEEYSSLSLELGFNLFNGFTDRFKRQAALKSASAQKHSLKAVKQDIALSAKKAYIDVLLAIENIKVAGNAVQLLENQLRDTKLSYDVGYVAKNEVLKVEAELSSSEQSMLSAKSAFRRALFNLQKITGMDISESEIFDDVDKPAMVDDYPQLKDKMLANRSELKFFKDQIEALSYNAKAQYGGYLPKINLGASYNTYGEDTSPSDRSYSYDKETLLSANVSVNLFDGLQKYNSGKSITADKLSLIAQMRNTKANMILQLKNAVEAFDLAKASLETAEKELNSAKENYRITQNQFKEKVATNTDLLDARVMLTRAEKNYSSARFSIQKALAEIERITAG